MQNLDATCDYTNSHNPLAEKSDIRHHQAGSATWGGKEVQETTRHGV